VGSGFEQVCRHYVSVLHSCRRSQVPRGVPMRALQEWTGPVRRPHVRLRRLRPVCRLRPAEDRQRPVRGRGQHAVDLDVNVGSQGELHCTAIGKALLAHLPEGEQKTLIAQITLARHAPNTITSKKVLREALAYIREQGLAADEEESAPGAQAIAVPVLATDGDAIGAISLLAPHSSSTVNQLRSAHGKSLFAAANASPPSRRHADSRRPPVEVPPRLSSKRICRRCAHRDGKEARNSLSACSTRSRSPVVRRSNSSPRSTASSRVVRGVSLVISQSPMTRSRNVP
jgi:Bacterial transcriptional regulator